MTWGVWARGSGLWAGLRFAGSVRAGHGWVRLRYVGGAWVLWGAVRGLSTLAWGWGTAGLGGVGLSLEGVGLSLDGAYNPCYVGQCAFEAQTRPNASASLIVRDTVIGAVCPTR